MNSTAAFLGHVLPAEGVYVCTTISPKGAKYNTFCGSIEELARTILATDARGLAVYHACASFREARHDPRGTALAARRFGRTGHNALGARSLWLDIDAGREKPYADRDQAIRALADFCGRTGLPVPIVVSSGRGIHAYWVLDVLLDVPSWRQLGAGLKRLCEREGLAADPARTADIASILRTPGTTNRKDGTERPVVCGPLTGPYPVDQIRRILDVEFATAPSGSDGVQVHSSSRKGRISAILERVQRDEVGSLEIASGCGQIHQLRASRGNLPEPLWYACLGVLAFAGDGDQHAHEWSAGYAGYTARETQERLDRARGLTGATTCEKFHALNPKTCEACPQWHKIKSPISLGRVLSDGNVDTVRKNIHADHGNSTRTPPEGSLLQVNGFHLPELPTEYVWGPNQELQLRSSKQDGSEARLLISTYPIYLESVQQGEVRQEFNYNFQQLIPEKGLVDIPISAKELFGPSGAGVMAEHGANIHDDSQFRRFVKHAVDQFYRVGRIGIRFDQFGWKDDGRFLYGRHLYAAGDIQPVSCSREIETRSQWVGPGTGDLKTWTEAANTLFVDGCEAQGIAVLASFGAPLIHFLSQNEGGAIVSLVTRQSGTGKTTALAGASSVWSDNQGLSVTNEDTKISKFLTLAALGNLPVIYDEVDSTEKQAVRQFIMNFTLGRDKMRATRQGEIRHSASTWQTLMISASNGSMVDALSGTAQAEAPSYRILEMPLTVPKGRAHQTGDLLIETLLANRGLAGDAYLRWLVVPENLRFVRAELLRVSDDIWQRTKLASAYRFWVRAAACIVVAAHVVRKLNLLDFDVEKQTAWLLAHMGATEAVTEDWAVAAFGEFLNQSIGSTIVVKGPFRPGERPSRPLMEPRSKDLTVRYEIEGQRYIVATSALREWLIKKEVSFREMIGVLSELGIVTDRRKLATLAAGTEIPSSRVLCIEVDASHPRLTGHRLEMPGDNVVQMGAGR